MHIHFAQVFLAQKHNLKVFKVQTTFKQFNSFHHHLNVSLLSPKCRLSNVNLPNYNRMMRCSTQSNLFFKLSYNKLRCIIICPHHLVGRENFNQEKFLENFSFESLANIAMKALTQHSNICKQHYKH